MTNDGPPLTISAGIRCNGQFSILIICNFVHRANSNGKLAKFGLSFKYKCSKFSSWPFLKELLELKDFNEFNYFKNKPISSGIDVKLFSPTLNHCKLVSDPIVRGNCVIWFDAITRRVSSLNEPISNGKLSSLFSSKSSVFNFLKFPINGGIL